VGQAIDIGEETNCEVGQGLQIIADDSRSNHIAVSMRGPLSKIARSKVAASLPHLVHFAVIIDYEGQTHSRDKEQQFKCNIRRGSYQFGRTRRRLLIRDAQYRIDLYSSSGSPKYHDLSLPFASIVEKPFPRYANLF
jgi:hypothetical protein